MTKENQEKMITAMQMMKEACTSCKFHTDCFYCPFENYCAILQRGAIDFYGQDNYEQWCPEKWRPSNWEKET